MSQGAARAGSPGRYALVTGAAGGIGLAVVQRLRREGYQVVATDLREARALPDGVRFVPFDLAGATDWSPLLETFEETGLHCLVNAAGLALFDDDGSVLGTDEEVWTRTLQVNLHALRRLLVAAVPLLRRHGGSVVNVASIAGLRGMDSPLDAYQVSKAAVVSLSRSLALQLGPDGVRVNTVCPGAILTPMIEYLYERDPSRRTDMESRTPLRRLGRPEDVAGAVAFLASDESAFVTATDLVVDGGWTAQVV